MKNFFDGTYYKHQKDGKTISIIVGQTHDQGFLQVITNEKSYVYNFEDKEKMPVSFGNDILTLNLPDIKGQVEYFDYSPIKGDIMGPFRHFPMECRHKIHSMSHNIHGSFMVHDTLYDFDGGKGYIEGDSGTSFPKEYCWIQCNDFSCDLSIFIAIAHIPFGFCSFRGCIAIIHFNHEEYRFATYLGVKIKKLSKDLIVLTQGKYTLEVHISERTSHPLSSPKLGQMSGTIYEGNDAKCRFIFFENGQQLFDQKSNNVSFEWQYNGSI